QSSGVSTHAEAQDRKPAWRCTNAGLARVGWSRLERSQIRLRLAAYFLPLLSIAVLHNRAARRQGSARSPCDSDDRLLMRAARGSRKNSITDPGTKQKFRVGGEEHSQATNPLYDAPKETQPCSD